MTTEAVVAKRSAGRRLAGLFHGRPRLQVGALLAAPGRLAGDPLPGVAGGPADHRLLDRRPAQRRSDQGLQPRKLRSAGQRTGLPRHRLADRPHRRCWSPSPTPSSPSRSPSTWPRSRAAAARRSCVVAVLMPLWSSYLVKVLSWRTMLSEDGVINWALEPDRPARSRLRPDRGLAGDELPLAAVHDPADLRRPRADPRTR